jgi:hypothetical protein
MGRGDTTSDASAPVEFEIVRLRWVDGDYDEGGAYWGRDTASREYIFRAAGESEAGPEEVFLRARTLDDAKAQVLAAYPEATFAASADLEAFASGYEEAALFFTHNDRAEEDPENESEFLADSGRDLAPEALASMRADCEIFLVENRELVSLAVEAGRDIGSCGHDFWLTRSGSGAGFWDRGLGKLGDDLSDAARKFGEVELYIGDDNLIHSSGEGHLQHESSDYTSAPLP